MDNKTNYKINNDDTKIHTHILYKYTTFVVQDKNRLRTFLITLKFNYFI